MRISDWSSDVCSSDLDVGGRNVLATLEHRLHPWSAFVVVPLFALANAGVNFGGGLLGEAASTALPWAIALGLVFGKIVGIGAAVWLAVRTGLGRLPQGVGALHVVGVAAVAGIGFTVSLFIADLAYKDPTLTETAKVGIFRSEEHTSELQSLMRISYAV